jgi:hypothetical protein
MKIKLCTFLVMLALTACSGQTQPMTVTFEEGTCTLTGPTNASAKHFVFNWVIKDQKHSSFWIQLVQLDDGKSMQDLAAVVSSKLGRDLTNTSLPWVHIISFDIVAQPGPISKDVTWDLTPNGHFREGPAYFVCSIGDSIPGILGPVEVSDK